MNYGSIEFLALFPIYALIYWLLPGQRSRLAWVLVGSLLFYTYGDLAGLPILFAVAAIGYVTGIAIARASRPGLVVASGITALVAILATYKYGAAIAGLGLIPPLGVSFFTFEAIAYIADVRRRIAPVERSPFRFLLYMTLFPHLISGPIMRPNDLFPQLRRRITAHLPDFAAGLQLFVEGLAKKRLLADPAGLIVDRVFALPAGTGTTAAWLAALAYTIQIYGDFSGYTDMGRGVARMLGLELPLNFAAPYTATSVRDFWRRWHISLSSWLRDYLYIPLGGNRLGASRADVNLLVTMMLGGMWHGGTITFALWGLYHGVAMLLERRLPRLPVPPLIAWLATLLVIVNGWVLFRARDVGSYLDLARAMYLPQGGRELPLRDAAFVVAAFVLVVGLMAASRIAPRSLAWARSPGRATGLGYATLVAAVLMVAPTETVPFIYFRF